MRVKVLTVPRSQIVLVVGEEECMVWAKNAQ